MFDTFGDDNHFSLFKLQGFVPKMNLNVVYNRRREKEAVVCAAIESVRKVWEN